MPFLNPIFLLALAAASFPVALHLLNRRNPKPVPFSTLRFLETAIAKTRKSRHLTQVMILLLRVLIIALLALAFARPRLRSSGWLPDGPRTVVMVVDGSVSMRARQGDQSNFERARGWALELLRQLRDRDRVSLIIAGVPDGRVIFPAISNHGLVEKAIREADCGFGSANLAAVAIQAIEDLTAKDKSATLELHVFTDAQASSWPRDDAGKLGALLKDQDARLFVNRLSMPTAGNASLQGVEVIPEALLGAGEIMVRGKVAADAKGGGANVVRAIFDGQERAQSGLTVPPGGEQSFSLPVAMEGGNAFVQGRLQIQDDPLAEDNTLMIALAQQDHASVLLVNGSEAPVDFQADTYYLQRALNPQRLDQPLIRATTIGWGALAGTELAGFQAVMICNPPVFDATLAVKLEQYARNGGKVLLYPGASNGLVKSFQLLTALKALSLKEERFSTTQTMRFLHTDRPSRLERGTRHALREMPGIDGQARLQIQLPEDPLALPAEADFYFQYATGTPVGLYVPFGSGGFWVLSLTANRAWSEWPLSPSFVIFHQLVVRQSFEQNRKTARIEVGATAELGWTGEETRVEADVIGPAGQRTTRILERNQASQPFLTGNFLVPGFYRFDLRTTPPGQRLVAVNVPPAESQLIATGESELAQSVAPAEVFQAFDAAQQRELVASLTTGNPLWPWLLLAAFLLGIAEVLIANMRSWRQSVPDAMQAIMRGRR